MNIKEYRYTRQYLTKDGQVRTTTQKVKMPTPQRSYKKYSPEEIAMITRAINELLASNKHMRIIDIVRALKSRFPSINTYTISKVIEMQTYGYNLIKVDEVFDQTFINAALFFAMMINAGMNLAPIYTGIFAYWTLTHELSKGSLISSPSDLCKDQAKLGSSSIIISTTYRFINSIITHF